MKDEVIIKFYKPDNTSFTIRQNGNWRFLKNGLVGFGLANGQLSYVDNVMGDGGEIKNVRLTRVDRTVKAVYMLRDYNENARRAFTKFFTPRLTYKIYLTYMGVTRWAEGTLYKLQMSEKLDDELLLNATMTFAFANPLWKSVDNFGQDIASIFPRWGFPWMVELDHPVPVGVFNFSQEVIMNNDGDVASYPKVIIQANGYVQNPSITINSSTVKINDTLEDSDEVVLDFGALPPTVRKNGTNIFGKADKTSQFKGMYLDIGDNVVSFDADNGSDSMAVTVFYNKMYTVI